LDVLVYASGPAMVETEEEYELSKRMLISYVTGKVGMESCNRHQHILSSKSPKFITEYFIVYDEFFLFYKRKHIRHFDVSTNSAHEGTNLGMRSLYMSRLERVLCDMII
jgi:hypothetical protein